MCLVYQECERRQEAAILLRSLLLNHRKRHFQALVKGLRGPLPAEWAQLEDRLPPSRHHTGVDLDRHERALPPSRTTTSMGLRCSEARSRSQPSRRRERCPHILRQHRRGGSTWPSILRLKRRGCSFSPRISMDPCILWHSFPLDASTGEKDQQGDCSDP